MCGICGVFAIDGPLRSDVRASVPAMTSALIHRGPDGEGFFNAERVSLGHRRLAIIDLASGDQPMTNEDGSCWIVFNGEIYNHRDVRVLLESKGHRFKTASDTEVILHAYEEFGSACVDKIEGMFAFAIYDGRRHELFAARDRLGKKPFFYTVLNGVFHFASELPALAKSVLWKGEPDLTTLEGYLSLGYFLAPKTIYRDVHKLPPGCHLRVTNRRVNIATYWDVTEFDTDDRPVEMLVSDIEDTLRQAVRDRLESEVPIGAFLSGGIDSGLVVSFMAEAMREQVVTTSVGFAQSDHNELEAASWTASHFGSRHCFEVIQPHLAETIEPVTAGLGEPLADSSAIPTWYTSRAAREHVTVALSGDGGDETFAGYDFRYAPHSVESAVRSWIPNGLSPAVAWLGAKWPKSRRLPRVLRLATVLENLGRDEAAAYYADLAFLKPVDARLIMGQSPDRDPTHSPIYEAATEHYRRCPSTSPVQRAEYADLKVYLPNDSLVKVDRMSMAHGLEVRCPLLDRRLVELAFRIPAARKQTLFRGKVLLRDVARRRLPPALWRLPKRGFTAPIGAWISSENAAMFQDEVLRPSSAIAGLLDRQEITRRFHEHRKGESDQSYGLWAVWVLERWLKRIQSGRSVGATTPVKPEPLPGTVRRTSPA
jgi:asparagine synthase (glutamine-hydrolysing)